MPGKRASRAGSEGPDAVGPHQELARLSITASPFISKHRYDLGGGRMRHSIIALILTCEAMVASPAIAQSTITERSVGGHEAFLASEALHGRGSATRDEAIAAAYVGSRFQSYGFAPAPGMSGYLQTATIVRQKLSGPPTVTVDGVALPEPTLLIASGQYVSGRLAIATDSKSLP